MQVEKREYPIDSLALKRFNICKLCAFYIEKEIKCGICEQKVKHLVNQDLINCPVGKW